jgi:hypothetical protein
MWIFWDSMFLCQSIFCTIVYAEGGRAWLALLNWTMVLFWAWALKTDLGRRFQ